MKLVATSVGARELLTNRSTNSPQCLLHVPNIPAKHPCSGRSGLRRSERRIRTHTYDRAPHRAARFFPYTKAARARLLWKPRLRRRHLVLTDAEGRDTANEASSVARTSATPFRRRAESARLSTDAQSLCLLSVTALCCPHSELRARARCLHERCAGALAG